MRHRLPVIEEFSWQPPVASIVPDPLVSVKGTRYIVYDGVSDTNSVFYGHDRNIAWYDGVEWLFDGPQDGWRAWIIDKGQDYLYVNNKWIPYTTGSSAEVHDQLMGWRRIREGSVLKDQIWDGSNWYYNGSEQPAGDYESLAPVITTSDIDCYDRAKGWRRVKEGSVLKDQIWDGSNWYYNGSEQPA